MPCWITDTDVLAEIAASEGCAPEALHIERGIVWRLDEEGWQRAVCAVGTPWWREQAARALAIRVLQRAAAT